MSIDMNSEDVDRKLLKITESMLNGAKAIESVSSHSLRNEDRIKTLEDRIKRLEDKHDEH